MAKTLIVQSINPDFSSLEKSNILNKKIRIKFDEFVSNDEKSKDNIIGEARTGIFNSKSDIISEDPVNSIITKALKIAFEKQGFIIDEEKPDFIITGAVERFWVDEHATGMSFEYSKAYVKYDLFIKTESSKIIWGNTIDHFEKSGNSMDTTEYDIPTLEKALLKSIQKLFLDNSFWASIIK